MKSQSQKITSLGTKVLLYFFFTMVPNAICAQKLPNVQKSNLPAPANIKIDGRERIPGI